MGRHDGRGNTSPTQRSPLPQGYPRPSKTPVAVRIVNGFTFSLPGRTRLFFQRQFFSTYPRPIQAAGLPPFPRDVPIATIQAPTHQGIILREVKFSAYQHSGIGIEDIVAVPESRSKTYLGFKFNLGNRGLTDFQTNLPGTGVPIDLVNPQTAGGTAPRAGQGSIHQGTGSITPRMPNENFAAYAQPGDTIQATAVVLRPPSFDLRLFEVEISGWLANETEMDKIIDHLKR
jgi:hypothetical protein